MKNYCVMVNYKCKCCFAIGCGFQLLIVVHLWQYQYKITPMRFRPMPKYLDVLSEDASQVQVERWFTGCSTLPLEGYKSWKQGVLTVMQPRIHRNCSLLLRGNAREVSRVRKENKVWNSAEFDRDFYDMAIFGNCSKIRSELMENLYVTKEELDFPLAFLLNVHDHPQQIFRFLKVIYRPHNLYCLHYDLKSSNKVKRAMENIAKCVGNVFIPKPVLNVVWGCSTIMEAQMSCMKALYNARSPFYPWRYATSLCGKELPLRTNSEMVKILKRLNGSSSIQLYSPSKEELNERFTYRFTIGLDNRCHQTRTKLVPVPHNITIRKSMAYFSLTPEFIRFLFHNKTALELYEYMKGAGNPEEHYISTVYSLTGKLFVTLVYHVQNQQLLLHCLS